MRLAGRYLWVWVVFAVWPFVAIAEQGVRLTGGLFAANRQALIAPAAPSAAASVSVASLFTGQESGSLFAPYPVRLSAPMAQGLVSTSGSQADRVRHLIARAEAGPLGYDAVQYGATIRPSKRPTDMTIAEIYDWIDATPGQPHAIGRYQFIPATLRRLVVRLGASPQARFSPALQDQLADLLLIDAGMDDFLAGDIARHTFMNNLAKIWAGLPNSSGQSHYHGFAGNAATMTWASFDLEMSRIFPS